MYRVLAIETDCPPKAADNFLFIAAQMEAAR
jgi:hypothetical protein